MKQFRQFDKYVSDIKNDINKMTDYKDEMLEINKNKKYIEEQYKILLRKFNNNELSRKDYEDKIEDIGCEVFENYELGLPCNFKNWQLNK